MEYKRIPEPKKILLIDNFSIFYKDSHNNIKIFHADKKFINSLPDFVKKNFKQNFKKIKIIGDMFIWNENSDNEIAIGKDTIQQYSKNITLDEYLDLLKKLNKKRKISKQKIMQALNSLL